MKDGVISGMIVDNSHPYTDRAKYIPNTDYLNHCIQQWSENGIRFCGIFHSHPSGQESLSPSDLAYITAVFKATGFSTDLYFPIVIPEDKIIFYSVTFSKDELVLKKVSPKII